MSNIDDICEKLDRLSTAIEQQTFSIMDLVKIANERTHAAIQTIEPPLPAFSPGDEPAFVQDSPSNMGNIPLQPIIAAPPQPPFAAWDPGNCPKGHGKFVLKPAGITKRGERAGQPYEPFWACNGKNPDGSFCKEKPRGQAA